MDGLLRIRLSRRQRGCRTCTRALFSRWRSNNGKKLAIEAGALLVEDVPGSVVLDDAQLLYVTSLLQSVVNDVVVATASKDGALKIQS